MTTVSSNSSATMWIAIHMVRTHHDVLVEFPDGRRRNLGLANTLEDYAEFAAFLCSSAYPCRIAFEPTGDYHRPLACGECAGIHSTPNSSKARPICVKAGLPRSCSSGLGGRFT